MGRVCLCMCSRKRWEGGGVVGKEGDVCTQTCERVCLHVLHVSVHATTCRPTQRFYRARRRRTGRRSAVRWSPCVLYGCAHTWWVR